MTKKLPPVPSKKHGPPPPPEEFTVVVSNWVEIGNRVVLEKGRYIFSGSLAQAKASLAGVFFHSAKIYARVLWFEELVATVRGTQTKQHPIS